MLYVKKALPMDQCTERPLALHEGNSPPTSLSFRTGTAALVGSREYGIDVQMQLDPEADKVFVDRVQIQQVLTNLIRNGIDAMIDAPVRSLIIRSTAGPDGLATVSVEDTGSGIDESMAPQLFQPFVSTKSEGMGLGLADVGGEHLGWAQPTRREPVTFSLAAGRRGMGRHRTDPPSRCDGPGSDTRRGQPRRGEVGVACRAGVHGPG